MGGTSSEQTDGDDFEACWQQSQEEVIVGEGKPIPGHPKAVPAHKSPRAKSPRSPGAECSKSPISDIVGLPDEDLRKLKISLLSSSPEKEVSVVQARKTHIKFSDEDYVTINPDDQAGGPKT